MDEKESHVRECGKSIYAKKSISFLGLILPLRIMREPIVESDAEAEGEGHGMD
jgi:hypothetical protein